MCGARVCADCSTKDLLVYQEDKDAAGQWLDDLCSQALSNTPIILLEDIRNGIQANGDSSNLISIQRDKLQIDKLVDYLGDPEIA